MEATARIAPAAWQGMRCRYCGAWNAEGDHRCERCGRRTGAEPALIYPVENSSAVRAPRPEPAPVVEAAPRTVQRLPGIPRQAALFGPERSKVIAFDTLAPVVDPRPPRKPASPAPRPAVSRAASRLAQQSLDFLAPAPRVAPTTGCEARVAPANLRCAAAVLDGIAVVFGLALFFLTFHLMGGELVLTKRAGYAYAVVAAALWLFYRVFWCILKRDSVGMRRAGLRLVDFDGYPPDGSQRAIRLAAACLGVLAAGVGLLWALFDEERLAWHDHISKTFPTTNQPHDH
jgi:uncharacterized RDD family membrane protein YckC